MLTGEVELKIDTVTETSLDENNKIATLVMTDDGQQIGLLLKDSDSASNQRYIELDQYTIKLVDLNGDEHLLKIDKEQIEYAQECIKEDLSDEECLAAITELLELQSENEKTWCDKYCPWNWDRKWIIFAKIASAVTFVSIVIYFSGDTSISSTYFMDRRSGTFYDTLGRVIQIIPYGAKILPGTFHMQPMVSTACK